MGMGRSSRCVLSLCFFTKFSLIHDLVHPESTSIPTWCRWNVSRVVMVPSMVIWCFPFPWTYHSHFFRFWRYHNAFSSIICPNFPQLSHFAALYPPWWSPGRLPHGFQVKCPEKEIFTLESMLIPGSFLVESRTRISVIICMESTWIPDRIKQKKKFALEIQLDYMESRQNYPKERIQ